MKLLDMQYYHASWDISAWLFSLRYVCLIQVDDGQRCKESVERALIYDINLYNTWPGNDRILRHATVLVWSVTCTPIYLCPQWSVCYAFMFLSPVSNVTIMTVFLKNPTSYSHGLPRMSPRTSRHPFPRTQASPNRPISLALSHLQVIDASSWVDTFTTRAHPSISTIPPGFVLYMYAGI
jgi:hypothetical protein